MSKKQKAPKDSLEEIPKDNQEAPSIVDSFIEEPSKEEYKEHEVITEEIVVETPKEMSQETTVKIEATKREDAPPKVDPPAPRGKITTTPSGNRMETF